MSRLQPAKKTKQEIPLREEDDLEAVAATEVMDNLHNLFKNIGVVMNLDELFFETRGAVHPTQQDAYDKLLRRVTGSIVNRGFEQYATQFDEEHGRMLDGDIDCKVDDNGEGLEDESSGEE